MFNISTICNVCIVIIINRNLLHLDIIGFYSNTSFCLLPIFQPSFCIHQVLVLQELPCALSALSLLDIQLSLIENRCS